MVSNFSSILSFNQFSQKAKALSLLQNYINTNNYLFEDSCNLPKNSM